MVSFNRNDSSDQSFPAQFCSPYHRRTVNLSTREKQRSALFLLEIVRDWDQILETASDLLAFFPTRIHTRRSVDNTHSDLAGIVISILNRCQSLIWMYETQVAAPCPSERSSKYRSRIKESIQQDLARLRQLFFDSNLESQLQLPTLDLASLLSKFTERLFGLLQ